ncbi:lymphocyte antigen 6 family member pge [Oryzias melastigma]|uniref:lymphocyte antigen 6 family member pge n=1 Tax=Oryzias melastigma TaxID=30732 RepID=UPI000CF80F38|nr:lymphocyte antigen 6 family member pge [Oryzias melastigma]XP_024153372.1 lymphocyte antigen 6 family member pge [Oryzias melastigma]
MGAVHHPLRILLFLFLLQTNCEALKCYTCMGSNNEDCNRQGSKSCPSYSDACAVVVGHESGVMKSCSYKSFCSQANSQGYRAPGVKVHCCYSNDCNLTSSTSQPPGLNLLLLLCQLLMLGWFMTHV